MNAVFAWLAFQKQSREVAAIEKQVTDQEKLTGQQAELLTVQSGQLAVLREQLEAQREASAEQSEVLRLQADELRESLRERKRAAQERLREQADRITAWFGWFNVEGAAGHRVQTHGAMVRNYSGAPVFDVRVFFHLIRRNGEGWDPVLLGGPPPSETAPVVPPAADHVVRLPENIRGQFGDTSVSDETCAVSFEFTDAAGNRWERDARGGLDSRTSQTDR